MLRCYLLALLLLLACWPAHAQGSLPIACSAAADTTRLRPAAATAPDTAAALHRLFATERHNGRVTLTVCGVVVGVSGLAYAVNPDLITVVAGGLLTVTSVIVAVPAAIRIATYSAGREQRMLRAWQQHQLPRRMRRQLQPAYFQPDSLREAVH